MSWDLALEILGFGTGILYLWYEYRADARLWIVSVIMPAISMWLYFRKGIYADFAINIYYLLIAIYGYIVWTKKSHHHTPSDKSDKSASQTLPIRHITLPIALACILAASLLWYAIYFVLANFTDSTVPIYDAFTTAWSIVAMWMLARKFAEQWLAWILVDTVCVGLYLYKGIPLYAILYAAYTIIAVFGYRKWLKLL